MKDRREYIQYYVEKTYSAYIDQKILAVVRALLHVRARGHVQHMAQTSPVAAKIVFGNVEQDLEESKSVADARLFALPALRYG